MTDSTPFYDDDVTDAVTRWTPDNVKEGTEFTLVKSDGKVYKGFVVPEVKDSKETGKMIKVYWFFVQIGKEVKEMKFTKPSMEKWTNAYGTKVAKWINQQGVITFGKVGSTKFIVATPKATLDA